MAKSPSDDVSVNLDTLLQVANEVFHNKKDYNDAVEVVQKKRKLKSIHTVEDHCTRALNLKTAEFKVLLRDKSRFINFLNKKYPEHTAFIWRSLNY